MWQTRKKITLSPRLKLGVGRGFSAHTVFRFSGMLFLLLALILSGNAVRLVWQHQAQAKSDIPVSGSVLGSTEQVAPAAQNSYFEFITYTVERGDTLFNLSQRHNISWSTLATLNELQSPFTLQPGQVLKIPRQ
jgi:hypothetical protein